MEQEIRVRGCSNTVSVKKCCFDRKCLILTRKLWYNTINIIRGVVAEDGVFALLVEEQAF